VRARWRSDSDDYAAIVVEIERCILAYVHGALHRKVARVFVVAGESETAFASALNSRLHEPSSILAHGDDVAFDKPVDQKATLVSPLLAAALAQ
jgi:hypothetical protein